MNKTLLTCLPLLLCACAAPNPVPNSYSGPTALVADTFKNVLSDRGDFCILEKIDGQQIKNAIGDTIARSQGRGFSLSAVATERRVPAKPLRVSIRCQTIYAAPILAMTNTVRGVSGEVDFRPEPDGDYVVRGNLDSSTHTAWIEEYKTKKVVTTVVSETKK